MMRWTPRDTKILVCHSRRVTLGLGSVRRCDVSGKDKVLSAQEVNLSHG